MMFGGLLFPDRVYYGGWSKKRHKVYGTIILQPYVTESCGFQQYVQKEILYMTKVSVWVQQLNIFCFYCWQENYSKTVLPSMYLGP